MKEFEKLLVRMEYYNMLDEIKENVRMEDILIVNKADSSFWVQPYHNYYINKLKSTLNIIYIKMDHKSEDDILTFSCIDSKKAFYATINSSGFDLLSFQLHRHDFFECMLVMEGELEVEIEKEIYRYRRGDLCLINCNLCHKEDYSKDFQAIYLCLKKEYLEVWAEEEMAGLGNGRVTGFLKENLVGKVQKSKNYLDFIYLGDRSGSEEIRAEKLLLDISEELMEHRPGYKSIIKGMITRLFCILQEPNSYTSKYVKLDSIAEGSLFEEAVRYIEEKKCRVTRNELAIALHYNGDYINQIFLKNAGKSLHDYSLDVCLLEAKKMLLDTSLSVTDIIKKLGFENRTSFYQHFLKRFGRTPMQYRVENVTNNQR